MICNVNIGHSSLHTQSHVMIVIHRVLCKIQAPYCHRRSVFQMRRVACKNQTSYCCRRSGIPNAELHTKILFDQRMMMIQNLKSHNDHPASHAPSLYIPRSTATFPYSGQQTATSVWAKGMPKGATFTHFPVMHYGITVQDLNYFKIALFS
jgi:hypothetical protein